MHLFTQYLQPLTTWLYTHPDWALFITFLISFSESLAIIGSIIPGSVTMTAIGILAGSGVMRVDLTLIAATLGAMAGDSGSYFLGYIFSDRLTYIWPFSRYPNWLKYGNDYFNRHGGKSVLIGRFAGPLRSIIPVIAGMMRMRQWQFFLANFTSAIGWSILYVMPGVLIGAASSELSTESATRLFIIILVSLCLIWILGQGIKWLFLRIRHIIHANLETFGHWAEHHPHMANFLNGLKPKTDQTLYPSIALITLFLFCVLAIIVLVILITQSNWIFAMNQGVLFFLQSLRTQPFDNFFIVLSLILTPFALLIFISLISLILICKRNWHFFRYWLGLSCFSLITAWLLNYFINYPVPENTYPEQITSTLSPTYLIVASSLFCFLMFYYREQHRSIFGVIFRGFTITLLVLSSFALVYLGDNWLSNVFLAYLTGLTISILFWIPYRRHYKSNLQLEITILVSCLLFIPTTYIQYTRYFKQLVNQHYLYSHRYQLDLNTWWSQKKPILPIHTKNRLGQRAGVFNVQYAGSLGKLQEALSLAGWETQSNSLLYSLLMRAKMQSSTRKFPLIAELYLNKKPILTMTYQSANNKDFYLLRIWRSNYYIQNYSDPIWIGSIIYPSQTQADKMLQGKKIPISLFKHFLPALTEFDSKKQMIKSSHACHEILLIKEQSM